MKTSTMIWIGAAAVAGYYLVKRAQATGVGQAAQAVTTVPAAVVPGPTAAMVPAVVVVQAPSDDGYDVDPGWGWAPSWGTIMSGRGGGGHHHGGHGHGGHH